MGPGCRVTFSERTVCQTQPGNDYSALELGFDELIPRSQPSLPVMVMMFSAKYGRWHTRKGGFGGGLPFACVRNTLLLRVFLKRRERATKWDATARSPMDSSFL